MPDFAVIEQRGAGLADRLANAATGEAQWARLTELGLRPAEPDRLRDVDTYDDGVAVAALAAWSRFAAAFELLTG